jgi:hypothetical protein
MNVFLDRIASGLVAGTGLLDLSCAPKTCALLDPMHAAPVCDTTPMKGLGRVVEIPEMQRRLDFGVLTGAVVQDETGDASKEPLLILQLLILCQTRRRSRATRIRTVASPLMA